MKTAHADYETERLKLTVETRCFVRFSHIHEHGAAADYPFSVDFSTDAVVGSSKTKLAYIAGVSVSPAMVEAASGAIDGGGFDIDLVDVGGEVLRYLSAPALTLKTAMTRTSPGPGGLIEINQGINGLPSAPGTIDILTRVLRPEGPRTKLASVIASFITPPSVAPSGIESSEAGDGGLSAMAVGDYRYKYTWVNVFGGQTTPSPESATITLTTLGLGIRVSGVAVGPAGTTRRRIYRTKVNAVGGPFYLVGEIENNTATTYDDAMGDAQAITLGEAPGGNTFPVAGNVPAGRHSYRATFMDELTGESAPGPKSAVIFLYGATTVNLSAIPTGPSGTAARRIYRSEAGDDGPHLFLTEIADNVTTVFVDTVTDGALGVTIDPSPSKHVTIKECVRYDQLDQVAKTLRVASSGRGVDGTFATAHRAGDAVTNGEQIRPGTRVELFLGYGPLDETKYMRWQKAEVVERFLLPDGVTWRVKCDDIQRTMRRELFVFASDDQPVKLKGSPFEIALRVMTSTGFRRSNGAYDVLAAENGIAMPRTFVDTTAFLAMKETLDSSVPQQPPPITPVATVGSAGNVDVGTHSYKYTWVDKDNNATLPSRASAVVTISSSAKRVTVRDIKPGPAGTVKRRVYRTAAGDAAPWKLVRTITNNTETTCIDNVADAALGADAPSVATFKSRLVFEFEITKPVQAKDWLQKEIFRPTNTYPIILQDGRISLRRYQPAPAPGDVTQALTDDDLIDVALVSGDRMVINNVIVAWNFNLPSAPNQFGDRLMFTADESKKRHGHRPALVIEAAGLRSDGDNEKAVLAILQERVDTVFKRFADPPVTVRCSVFYRRHTWEVGDCLKLTYALIPNLKFGVRGMTDEVFEIIHMRPYLGLEGHLDLTLLHTGSISIPPPAARQRVARLGRRGIAVEPPRPGGLRIIGQTSDDFTGRDIKITWRAVSIRSSDEDNLVAHPEFIQGYVIEVINPATGKIVRRSAVAAAPHPEFLYAWERNVEDNGAAGLRSVRFSVRARTMWGLEGRPAIITVSNPAPTMAPMSPVVTMRSGGLLVDWAFYVLNDTDLEKFDVLVDTVNPPVVVAATKSRKERKALIPDPPAGTTVYVRILPHDAYGPGTPSAVAVVNTTPTTPSGLTAVTKPAGVLIRYARITDPLFSGVEVSRGLVNDRALATVIEESAGPTQYLDTGDDLTSGAKYRYWLRTRDIYGNHSPFHAGDTSGLLGVAPVIAGYQRVGSGTPFAAGQGQWLAAAVDTIDSELDILQTNLANSDVYWGESSLAGKLVSAQVSRIVGTYNGAPPSVVFDGANLQGFVFQGTGYALQYVRFTPGGTLSSGPTTIETPVAGAFSGIDYDGGSTLYAAWIDELFKSARFARLNLSGVVQGSILTLWTESTLDLLSVAPAVDEDGNVHLIYALLDNGPITTTFHYRKYSSAGVLLAGPTALTLTDSPATNDRIALLCRFTTTKQVIGLLYDHDPVAGGARLLLTRLTKSGAVQIYPRTLFSLDEDSPAAPFAAAMDPRNDNLFVIYENLAGAVKFERFERVDA